MLRKKKALSKISKRRLRSSVVSVLMTMVLVTTPIYSDEMEMEEYIDYDDSSYYDYSYEDYSYDDYESNDDSGYEESGSEDSGSFEESDSEDSGGSEESDNTEENKSEDVGNTEQNESDENTSKAESGTDEQSETQKNMETSNSETASGVDESENTARQEQTGEEMTMTTNDSNTNEYVESTMDVHYEQGGQADETVVTDSSADTNTVSTTNAVSLTGDPITDIVSIVTNGLNELKEAIIKASDMTVETKGTTDADGSIKENPTETSDGSDASSEIEQDSSDDSSSENTIDVEAPGEIDLTNTESAVKHTESDEDSSEFETEEVTEQDVIIRSEDASEEMCDPSTDSANTENPDENNSSEENQGDTIDLDPAEDHSGEENSEMTNPDEQNQDTTTDQDDKQLGDTESTPENQSEDTELTSDQQPENTEENEKENPSYPAQNQIVTEEESDQVKTNEQQEQKQEEQSEQEIIDLIGGEQKLIDLTGNESQEMTDLINAIEEGQKPPSEEALVSEMVVDIIDLAEEIGTTSTSSYSSSSSSNYGGGYSSATYMNSSFTPQPRQQTREEWMNSLTPYERMLTGMTKTEERPAIVSADVKIYSGRGEANTVVGVLPSGGVCYILEDGEWAYIESGEVRGFIRASELSEGNIANNINVMPRAESMIDPNYNTAFNYLNITTSQIPEMPSNNKKKNIDLNDSISRNEVIAYAMQTDSMMNSSSGFVKDVYSHFGISLPDSTNDQSYVGERIDVANVRPGDLLFYKDNGVINDVLICIGDGKVVRMGENGKCVEEIDFDKVCWATRLIPGATQASEFSEIGQKAAEGDETARNEIIVALADASEDEWNTYGFPRSVLIAEAIMESNWLSFHDAENGGMRPEDNNIMNMNEHLRNDEWESPWTGDMIQRNIPRYENGEVIYGNEMMRAYNDIESCFNDYAAFKTDQHPNLEGETDVDIIIEEGLQGYATDPDYQSAIKRIIEQYDLTQFDNLVIMGAGNYTDSTNYSQDQLELIWAITAQEDDTSYEGALAVISTAMNRAEQNYGGHGVDALSQLTADGQFCYSPSVSDPIYYQRRLNGNVPEFVKQAVFDCLEKGVRNHTYLNFRSSNRTGNYTQIGGNWFF
jgi:hypothetical protein